MEICIMGRAGFLRRIHGTMDSCYGDTLMTPPHNNPQDSNVPDMFDTYPGEYSQRNNPQGTAGSEQPKRRKGADHFGYGHQVALGKNKDGESVWHSHGKHYHKPDTFWCGHWGDRTPEELLLECDSTLEDLRLYFPELFRSRPHTSATAPDDNDLEELGNQDIDPKAFEIYARTCDEGAKEQYFRELAEKQCQEMHDASVAKAAREQEDTRISNEIDRILSEHPARIVNHLFIMELKDSLRSQQEAEQPKEERR